MALTVFQSPVCPKCRQAELCRREMVTRDPPLLRVVNACDNCGYYEPI
jgi:hypothetical protein